MFYHLCLAEGDGSHCSQQYDIDISGMVVDISDSENIFLSRRHGLSSVHEQELSCVLFVATAVGLLYLMLQHYAPWHILAL